MRMSKPCSTSRQGLFPLRPESEAGCMLFHHHSYILRTFPGSGTWTTVMVQRFAATRKMKSRPQFPDRLCRAHEAGSLLLSPVLLFSSFVVIEKRETSPIFPSIHTHRSHSSIFCFPILLSLFSFISLFLLLFFFPVDGKISSGGDFLKRAEKQAVTGICGTVRWGGKKVRV